MTDAPAAADGYPQIGMQHKNGDRMFGIAGPFARTLAERGIPKLSSLYHSTVTERVRAVRVGDELRVEWDGSHWWASSSAGVVGRLSWPKGLRADSAFAPGERSPYDFDTGTLHVQSVTVDVAGAVVDCGGYVVPAGHNPADWSSPPVVETSERELRVTLPAPARVVAAPNPPARSFLSRLLGRDR